MDHLNSTEERKKRWYADHIVPKYLSVSKESTNCAYPENVIAASSVDKDPTFLRSRFASDGFVIITDVLTNEECNHALSLLWDYLEAASAAEQALQTDSFEPNTPSPVKRHDTNTYTDDFFFPRSVEGKIYPFYGSGHTQFNWFLRSHPKLQEIFASFHNVTVDDLVSSLDGLIAWTLLDNGANGELDTGWFHIDQNPVAKPNFETAQGLVNLLPVTEESGGNVVVIDSHLKFPGHYTQSEDSTFEKKECCNGNDTFEFYRKRLKEVNGDDWLEIDPNDDVLLQEDKIVTFLLRPGDVFLWDSRLVHCSNPGRPTNIRHTSSSQQNLSMHTFSNAHGLMRAASLISMMPRTKVNDLIRERRMKAINSFRTLTHWVNKAAFLGEERTIESEKESKCVKFIRSWQEMNNKRKVLLSYDDLTNAQRKLV